MSDHSRAVIDAVHERADAIAATAEENEALGQLSGAAVGLLRETNVMKLLAPREYGGLEAHPAEFAEAVMGIAAQDGSTGWVAGIVGVHPWEMAMADPRVQKEIWGESTDVWIASPYAPMGVLTPVDGGYRLTGRWQFSSGTDHCDWIFLGALMGDKDGNPDYRAGGRHVILPRSDYTIVADSWDVVGLRGTGSKDVIVEGSFIPEYRVLEYTKIADGSQAKDAGLENPLYHVPFSAAFPLGITSAVIGICEGALAHHLAYQSTRVQITGARVKDDPYVLSAIGAAAAEIRAARVSLIDNVSRFFDQAAAGQTATWAERAEGRSIQVAAAWRAVNAMDQIVARSGGNGLRMDNPIQRFWRDAHMGLAHAIHVPGPTNHAAALGSLDIVPPPGPLHAMI